VRDGQISFLWFIPIEAFFLFSGIFSKKMRNSQMWMERKVMGMFFKEGGGLMKF